MKVELALLKPDPLRDFSIDPIDQEVVEALKESIRQDGFWGEWSADRKRTAQSRLRLATTASRQRSKWESRNVTCRSLPRAKGTMWQ